MLTTPPQLNPTHAGKHRPSARRLPSPRRAGRRLERVRFETVAGDDEAFVKRRLVEKAAADLLHQAAEQIDTVFRLGRADSPGQGEHRPLLTALVAIPELGTTGDGGATAQCGFGSNDLVGAQVELVDTATTAVEPLPIVAVGPVAEADQSEAGESDHALADQVVVVGESPQDRVKQGG